MFGRKKEDGEAEEKSPSRQSQASDRGLSGEWEILESPDNAKPSPEVAKKPPRVASKPKPSAGEASGTTGGTGGTEEQKQPSPNASPRKMPGMVAAAPISELANVLKGVALKPPAAKVCKTLSIIQF